MPIALGFKREIERFAYLLAGDRNMLGRAGELLAQIMFEANGYVCEIDHQKFQGDLRVTTPSGMVMRVEVKTSRKGARGGFQFNLWKKSKHGMHTNCEQCDVLVLLCVRPSGMLHVFILPGAAVRNRRSITLSDPSKRMSSKYAVYRQYMDSISLKKIEDMKGLDDEILV